jgi:hypothetical protein
MIYPELLKVDFEKLPLVLREFHSAMGERWAEGSVVIRHEWPWLARLVGFPRAGANVPVRLHVVAAENEEIWIRWFGNSRRRTTQRVAGGLLVEKAGPLHVEFRIFASETGLRFESHAARLWGIPLPLRMEAWARGGDAGWEVNVRIAHIGSYRGLVAPAQ